MVPDYPSNSDKSKSERVQLQPVVDAPAMVRKKKKKNKLLKLIFAQDFHDIEQGLVTEYVKPKMKDLSWSFIQAGLDLAMNALRMMVYEDYKPIDRSRLPTNSYTYSNYNGYYTYSQPYNYNSANKPSMTTEINYDEFTYATRGEAEAVLAELKNQITRCRCATVLDLYNLSRIDTSNYTLQDWGWTDLGFAEVRQGPDGYIIALPKAKMLPR